MLDLLVADEAWPHHWWFLIFPLFWLVVIALLIRFVFMRRGGCWSRGSSPHRAQGILAERYARGEIGDDEYRTRLERLRADAQT
jgi:putative membrane protein